MLLDWANTVHKTLASHVAFFKDDRRTARETLSFAAGQCVSYQETFVAGDGEAGAYVCQLIITSDGLSLAPGGAAPAFVAPAAREHGGPAVAAAAASGLRNMAIGGVMGTPVPDAHAAAWAADRAKALSPTRKAKMHATYVEDKKRKKKVYRDKLDEWWGEEGKRGGARLTVEGCLGEYQADKLFAAQGHEKLNHDRQLCGVLDLPRGRGLDGVWKNAAPPPEFLITETKFTTTPDKAVKLSSGGQMSDKWVLAGDRLTNALGVDEGLKMRKAVQDNKVGKRLLHIDSAGKLHEYEIDAKGKFTPLKK